MKNQSKIELNDQVVELRDELHALKNALQGGSNRLDLSDQIDALRSQIGTLREELEKIRNIQNRQGSLVDDHFSNNYGIRTYELIEQLNKIQYLNQKYEDLLTMLQSVHCPADQRILVIIDGKLVVDTHVETCESTLKIENSKT